MKAYITKYTLTKGIIEVEVRRTEYPEMVVATENSLLVFHGEGKDWHLTREGAIKRAEEIRLAKIASMEKTIKRLEAMKF